MSNLRERLNLHRAADIAVVSCVTTEERQSALIVSVWKGDSWVLPWAQFTSARFSSDRIDLTFTNCLVIVTGENLHALLADIADYRIGALRELPPDYGHKPADGEPFIARIEVRSQAGGSETRETS